MKAAVVNSFAAPPSFQDFPEPTADEGEVVIAVEAAALSPIVKSLASGRHYTSGGTTGFVPGVDGVGTDENGRRVYFLFPKAPFGSMAEKTLALGSMTTPIPQDIPSDHAAAIVTGALASWVALSRRARLQKGETVMILGATGASGGMAIQTAKYFGASRVIAVGRDRSKLERLNADAHIALDDQADRLMRDEFDRGIDVVLDFVWGDPASRALKAATGNRGSGKGEPRLRYVQLGTMAGDEVAIRGDMLRSTGLELIGSGIGSVAIADLLAGAGELLFAASAAGFNTPFTSLPLHAVNQAWQDDSKTRYVIVPNN